MNKKPLTTDNAQIKLEETEGNQFDQLRITIASRADILSWSYGEVKRAETINYRTLNPEKGGLFCSKIFGPVNDYECSCGKYKKLRYKGVICDRCGVEVTSSSVRRKRMGHIALAYPVVNPLILSILPAKLPVLLGISNKQIDEIVYFEKDVVIEPGSSTLAKGQILSHDESFSISCNPMYEDQGVIIDSGAHAIQQLLRDVCMIDLYREKKDILDHTKAEVTKSKIEREVELIQDLMRSQNKPVDMILEVIPVIPPAMRPLVPLDGGRFASSDINELYRRVLNRNNRLSKLISLQAPDIILRNEKRMLQDAVEALFDNTKSSKPFINSSKQPLKSISEYLKGKQGLFRHNILGKRVDYSGRSAIKVGPHLKLNQCGLPRDIAIELFKPFIYGKLLALGYTSTIRSAKVMVKKREPIIWDLLEEIIDRYPVILNRAPTLHKMSMQAFYPKLTNAKAIEVHPLVCSSFNADFDGDTMAVHIPISEEAKSEAVVLMLPSENLLSNANGQPNVGISQDIILGLYYATYPRGTLSDRIYYSEEVLREFELKQLQLNQKIRYQSFDTITSVGSVLLYHKFSSLLPFEFFNKPLDKKSIVQILNYVLFKYDNTVAVQFVDTVMQYGFKFATLSGASFRLRDLIVPENKKSLIQESENKVKTITDQYRKGLLTKEELYIETINLWSKTTELVAQNALDLLEQVNTQHDNSLYTMFKSGARGSSSQIRQVIGMRGLMVRQDGTIMDHPVLNNFTEGVDCFSYFNSTHGSRKGLSDTALRTANSGYMFRKLADAARDVVIVKQDCRTQDGIRIKNIIEDKTIISTMGPQIFGRVLSAPCQIDDEITLPYNTILDATHIRMIEDNNVQEVMIRSPITCKSHNGVCKMCYGIDLSTRDLPNLGDPVGVIAAQSIGEPGTQLTMRTFHKGGVSSYVDSESELTASNEGTVQLSDVSIVVNSNQDRVNIGRSGYITLISDKGVTLEKHKIRIGSIIYVTHEQHVIPGDPLLHSDPSTEPLLTTIEGTCEFVDVVTGLNLIQEEDALTGISHFFIKDSYLTPKIKIFNDDTTVMYRLQNGMRVHVTDGCKVKNGDYLATNRLTNVKSEDIVSGLPLITQLFDIKMPKNCSILSRTEGIVSLSSNNNRNFIKVKSDNGHEEIYSLKASLPLACYDGKRVKLGEELSSGPVDFKQVVSIFGPYYLGELILNNLQSAYVNQGISINNKHFEIIISQMIQKVKVTEPQNSHFQKGQTYNLCEVEGYNELHPTDRVIYTTLVRGVTKISTATESFLAAASFQDTIRVLVHHALKGSYDILQGSKENIIVGRKVKAGTHYTSYRNTIDKYINTRSSSTLVRSLLGENENNG